MQRITITANDSGRRLDRFLRKYLGNASLGSIQKVIRKDVRINGRKQHNNYILTEGDELYLYLNDDQIKEFTTHPGIPDRPQSRRTFGIIYEDPNILIVDKPYGLLTHGDRHEKKNHLANQVRDYLIAKGEYNPRDEKVFSPAPANRLDRNTTGLVLFGKTSGSLRTLNQWIREDRISKFYQTIVYGHITEPLILHARLEKDEAKNKATIRNADDSAGRAIETIVRPLRNLRNTTLVEVELVTGRTHQIRAHLASIGHPVIGDSKYATVKSQEYNHRIYPATHLGTQLLHSSRLEIRGDTGSLDYLCGKTFEAPLPARFVEILTLLENE